MVAAVSALLDRSLSVFTDGALLVMAWAGTVLDLCTLETPVLGVAPYRKGTALRTNMELERSEATAEGAVAVAMPVEAVVASPSREGPMGNRWLRSRGLLRPLSWLLPFLPMGNMGGSDRQ